MIGLLVVTHGEFGREMVRAVTMITGPQERMEGVAIENQDDMPSAARRIEAAYGRVDGGEGVIIFTDLLGGTPSNVCLTLLNKPSTEVISGVNLPMLLKAVTHRVSKGLSPVVELACRSGREGVTAATLLLETPPAKAPPRQP
jgi:PTS system mannose-specific IIA component